jgi:magnesium transporter
MESLVELSDLENSNLSQVKNKWAELTSQEKLEFFFTLSKDDAIALFKDLSTAEQVEIIKKISPEEQKDYIQSLRLDDIADLIQNLAVEMRNDVLMHLDPQTRREVIGLLAYEEDAAGGLMNPRYIRIRPDMTVGEAARYISSQAKTNVEIFYYAYVLEADQKLVGVLSFRDLILANQDSKISSMMKTDVICVHEDTDREEVLGLFSKYNFMAIPVVDSQGRMKGVVTYDDLAEVAEQEATEDIQKLGGMEALDAPYFQVSFLDMIKKRAGWLTLLFIGEMFTATAMANYEKEIERAVVLALFIPLIISSGGNSGSQASSLIIRSLALKEIQVRDWLKVLLRELKTGLILGLILALIGFLRIVIWQHFKPIYGEHYLLVAATVAGSLVGVVTWGAIAGAMLPFFFQSIKFDPASASAPFVATLVDVTGIVIYFTVASFVLRGILL